LWLTGWKYRRRITIHGELGAWINYQVCIEVGEGFNTSQCDFCLNWKSSRFPEKTGDGGDLRFTHNDGGTLLDFWVEQVKKSNDDVSRSARIWVKIDGNLNQNQVIYCYYGNPEATNYSDGTKTFLWFDDFSDYNEHYYNTDISLKGMSTTPPIWDSSCQRLQINTGQNTESPLAPCVDYLHPHQSLSTRIWFNFHHGYPNGAEVMLSVRHNDYGYYIASLLGSYVDPETGDTHENTNPSPTIYKSNGDTLATASTNSYLQAEQTLEFGIYNTNLYFFVNNTLVLSATDESFLSPGRAIISCTNCVGTIHQVLIRKFTYPEPYVQSVDDEEETEERWLIGWKYRKKITLEKEDYTYLLKIGESPEAPYTDLSVDSVNFPLSTGDLGDIRFTLSDGVTKLPAWVEKVVFTEPHRVAHIWVRCPQSVIYCYYGHPDPPTDLINNPNEVFEFYESFIEDPNKSGRWLISRHNDDTDNEFVWSAAEHHVKLTTNSDSKGSVALAILKRKPSGFRAKFQFKIDGNADGLAFATYLVRYIQGRCPIGGNLGLYGLNLQGSVIEFDECQNPGEPAAPHVAIAQRIASPTSAMNPDAWVQMNFNDGKWHECDIRHCKGSIWIYVDNKLVLHSSFSPTSGEYFAFSGTTGGTTGAHYLRNVSIQPYTNSEPKVISVSPPEGGDVETDYETFCEAKDFGLWESIDLSQKITYSYKTIVKKCLSGETARTPMLTQPILSTTIKAFGSEDTSYQIEQKARAALNRDIIIPHFAWMTTVTSQAKPDDDFLVVSNTVPFEEGGLVVVIHRNQYIRTYVIDYIYQQTLSLRTKLGVSFDSGDYVFPAFLGYIHDVRIESHAKHKVEVVTIEATEKILNDIQREGTASVRVAGKTIHALSSELRPKTIDVQGCYVDPRSIKWEDRGLADISATQDTHGVRSVGLKFTLTRSRQWQLLRDAFFYAKGRYLPIKVPTWRGECSVRYETHRSERRLRLTPRSYADKWEKYQYLCVDYGERAQLVHIHDCYIEGNHCVALIDSDYLDQKPRCGTPVHYVIDAYFSSDELTLDFTGEVCESQVSFVEKF